MEQDQEVAQHFVLCAGAGIVTCLRLRDGYRVVPPALVQERITVDGLSHLSISCQSSAGDFPHLFHVDAHASMRSSALRLSIRASRTAPEARVVLLDSKDSIKCALPIVGGRASLGEVEPDKFTVLLELGDLSRQCVGITLEPISVPNAIDAGMQCFCHGRFRTALAIFQRTLSFHPESRALSDLATVTRTFLDKVKPPSAADEHYEIRREGEQFDSSHTADLRNQDDLTAQAEIVQRSEELSRILSGCTALTATEWGHLMEVQTSRFSVAATTALRIARAEIVAALRPEVQGLAKRVDRIEVLSRELESGQRQIAESMARVETFVARDYTPYIYSCLGQDCAQWIGNTAISDIANAEEQYRGAMNVWVTSEPDFKVPLYSLLGALEVVIRTHFDATFNHVRNALVKTTIADYVRRTFKDRNTDIEKTKSRPFTLGQADKLITRGNAIASKWVGEIPNAAADLLSKLDRPDLTKPLMWLFELRNSIAHHKRTFTAREMLLARKLILGIDELKIQKEWNSFPVVESSNKIASYGRKHTSNLPYSWNQFPGIIRLLWGTVHGEQP